jgi:DNA replication protein DnaC
MVKSFEEPQQSSSGSSPNESEVCQICFGTGTKLEPGKGAALCDCRRTNALARSLESARIPPRFRDCTFHNYYPTLGNNSQYFAHSFASRLANEYPAAETGLLLMGPVGVGKTHLAIAILKELIEKKGVNCLFYESGSLLKAIQDSYNPVSQTSETRVLAPVYQAEVLVLDELGATVPTNWVRDTLYQIINTRYNNKKLTIFTTNFFDEPRNDAEASDSKRRTRDLTTLEERIGIPLRSRLYEMCKKVVLEGEDYRKRLNQRQFDTASG